MNEEFENAIGDWESNDGWQFADHKAERKFFFEAGQKAERIEWSMVVAQQTSEILNLRMKLAKIKTGDSTLRFGGEG